MKVRCMLVKNTNMGEGHGLCEFPEDYQYSSARFYELNINDWDFLTHYED
ncbi:MAG TPA: hypothetical protein PLM56_17500 [Cyclobacteriaceae bacterium]|nr:hypothetical protein [Cyclobacteriaceae bacterium]